MDFVAGVRVAARGLPWDLVEVCAVGAQQRLRLRCASGDLRGLEWEYPLSQRAGRVFAIGAAA